MNRSTLVIALASILAVVFCSGCVSDVEHERVTRELSKVELESARRAGEITALRQMLYYATYSASPQSQAASQAAMIELAHAYSDLVQRYGALSSDVEALKKREADHRASDPSPAITGAQTTTLPRRASSQGLVDPFMDR